MLPEALGDRAQFFDEDGRIDVEYTLDYPNPDDQTHGGTASGDRCGGDARNPANVSWAFSPIRWYINTDSFPGSMDKSALITNLRSAHAEWENNTNHCALPDNSSLNFEYAGVTSNRANSVDGFSTIDHGEITDLGIGYSSTAWATEATRFCSSTGQVCESDIRFDDDIVWTNKPANYPNRVDTWDVGAHEVGHRALFGHVSDSRQVMYQYGADEGQTIRRKLSLGDATGNNAKY